MPVPFSVLVASRAWRRSVETWTADRLAERGIRLTGGIEQPRVRPWSTQVTFETDAGIVWFKADCPGMSFEPALQATIARLAPGTVQEPLALDVARGWMLTLDHGPSLSDEEAPTASEWSALLRGAARAQSALVPHRDALVATGLPDCSPATVPARFDELRRALRRYPASHPGHLSRDADERLEAVRPAVVAACAALESSGLPSAWNHGDLHVHNAYRADGTLKFFDLGDGQLAHALEVLAVPVAWMRAQGLPEAAVQAAVASFLDEWDVEVSAEEFRAARITHAVNRSRTWWVWLDGTTPDELERFAREPEEHLLSVFDVLGEDERPDVV